RVARGRLAPRPVPAREMRKEDAQRCRLDRVESGVRPDELEGPLVARAVEAELADGVRDRRIGARDEPAVAEREEVLRREEAERGADARRRDPGRTERLRGILEQRDSERRQLAERRRTAEEVHGD